MSGRRRAIIMQTAFVTLAGVAGALLIPGCPDTTPCPNCTVKKAKFGIKKYKALDEGFTISEAELEQRISYQSHCPAPPTETPPCARSEKKSIMPVAGGDEVDVPLYLPTNNKDTETATLTVTMSKSGSPDEIREEDVSSGIYDP
ncbi:MAG: hypothetical protein AAF721_06500 [Myxococcota bacterium]